MIMRQTLQTTYLTIWTFRIYSCSDNFTLVPSIGEKFLNTGMAVSLETECWLLAACRVFGLFLLTGGT